MVLYTTSAFGKLLSKASYTLYSALHTPWCLLCLVRRVSLAEYILVLKVFFPHVADDIFYDGFYMTCLHPAGMRAQMLGVVL